MFVTAKEMRFVMPSEMKPVTTQSCRTGKRINLL